MEPFEAVRSTEGVQLAVKVWHAPAASKAPASPSMRPVIVIVHQYSILGGCQDLLYGIASELNDQGFTVVTFNLRGVGRSSGRASLNGAAEVSDVVAVCKWTAAKLCRPIVLVGSSAGANVAGSALDAVDAIQGFIGVGYVFGRWASLLFGRHFNAVLKSSKPKLFIMGERDGFTTPQTLQRYVAKSAGVADVTLIDGVGHFELEGPAFDGLVADHIVAFVNRYFSAANGVSIVASSA